MSRQEQTLPGVRLAASTLLLALLATTGQAQAADSASDQQVSTSLADVVSASSDDFVIYRAASSTADAEYKRSGAAAMINAITAYQAGYTGSGITVAVVDGQVSAKLLGSKIVAGGFNYVNGKSIAAGGSGSGTADDHGTAVAEVIAAARDGSGVQGIAYNAKIMPFAVFTASSFSSDDEGSEIYNSTYGSATLNANIRAIKAGVRIINNSWGIDLYLKSSDAATLIKTDSQTQSLISALKSSNSILVFAAGNESQAQVHAYAGLPYYYSSLLGHVVAAVAVDTKGKIASYSNRCGVAAAWCIAAPGTVTVPTASGTYTVDGTSFAAPTVSGALAVLAQEFPSLTSAKLLNRMFTTATKTGVYANTAIYGQGLLNLGAASKVVGTAMVSTKSTLSSGLTSASATALSFGPAFGQGFAQRLAGKSTLVFDSFDGAAFSQSLGSFAGSAPRDSLVDGLGNLDSDLYETTLVGRDRTITFGSRSYLAASLSGGSGQVALPTGVSRTQLTDKLTMSVTINRDAGSLFALSEATHALGGQVMERAPLAAPYFALADHGQSLGYSLRLSDRASVTTVAAFGQPDSLARASYLGTTGDDYHATVIQSELAWRPFDTLLLAGDVGLVRESGGVLGAHGSGALGLAGADTNYGGASLALDLTADLHLVGTYHTGWTRLNTNSGSMIAGSSQIRSEAWSAGLVGERALVKGDSYGLLYLQPMRVTSGSVSLLTATGSDFDGNVSHSLTSASVAADGAERDIEAFYSRPLGDDQRIGAIVRYATEPGNTKANGNDLAFMLHYAWRW